MRYDRPYKKERRKESGRSTRRDEETEKTETLKYKLEAILSCALLFVVCQVLSCAKRPIESLNNLKRVRRNFQNKYSYSNAEKRSTNTSSPPLIILINGSRLRHRA